MDETAFPILLYDMLWRGGILSAEEALRFSAVIEAAVRFHRS